VSVIHKLDEFEVGQAVLSMGGKRKLYVCRIDPEMRYPILCGTTRDADERDLSGWKPTELQIMEEKS
jgi:hypothetical protein